MVVTKTRDFEVYDELQKSGIVDNANATVQRIPEEYRGQWETKPITEESVHELVERWLFDGEAK